ncbi:MAG: hypothetical protein JWO89_3029 [Verrucomicrobiaceae bacterium]|nr:hypothetical protein [Verrucomicrobiaceae bacterium]
MPLYDRDYMRDQPSRKRVARSWLPQWTALHWIMAVNVAVFLAQHVAGLGMAIDPEGRSVPMGGASVNALLEGQFWTIVTSLFVHQTIVHLTFNLMFIWWAGSRVVSLLGSKVFLNIYFLSGLIGLVVQFAVSYFMLDSTMFTIIGASACAMGLVLAFAAIMPHESVTTMLYFIIPVNVTMRHLALGFLILNATMGLTALVWHVAPWAGVASFAHLGGALTGWYYVRLLGYGGQPMTYEQLWNQQSAPRPRPQRREVARVRRSRPIPAAPEIDEGAVRRRHQSPGRSVSPVVEEIDPILDKISTLGMNSLTESERRQLEAASREMAGKEKPSVRGL